MEAKLDQKDLEIIGCLKKNCKQSIYKIAKKTGLPPTTIHSRIKKLESNGVIKRYSVELDNEKMGKPLCVYTLINYDLHKWEKTRKPIEELEKELFAIEGVAEIAYVTGQFDILLKMNLKDINELNNNILYKLKKITGVLHTHTIIAIQHMER